MIYPEAFIRVAITKQGNGMVYCLPVNDEHEAIANGVNHMPCGLCVTEDALVASPMEREIKPIQLFHNGKKYNRLERKKESK